MGMPISTIRPKLDYCGTDFPILVVSVEKPEPINREVISPILDEGLPLECDSSRCLRSQCDPSLGCSRNIEIYILILVFANPPNHDVAGLDRSRLRK